MIDPSGGWSALANGLAKGLEISKIGVAAVTTFVGAIAGGAATAGSGNAKGMIVGAFLGLASNFSGSIGGAVVHAIVGVGKILANNAVEKAMPTAAPQRSVITNTGTTASGAINTSNNEQKNTSPRVFPFPVLEAITSYWRRYNLPLILAQVQPAAEMQQR
jgi:hypothetical protein